VTTALVPDPATQPTMQVDDVAAALGLSRGATYNGVQTGEIPSIRIGRRIVVPPPQYAACSYSTAAPTQREPRKPKPPRAGRL
jgi:excisionase family DNA binding protein